MHYALKPRTAQDLTRLIQAGGSSVGAAAPRATNARGTTWVNVTGGTPDADGWYPAVVSLDVGGTFEDLDATVRVAADDGMPLRAGDRYPCTRTGDAADGTARFRTRGVRPLVLVGPAGSSVDLPDANWYDLACVRVPASGQLLVLAEASAGGTPASFSAAPLLVQFRLLGSPADVTTYYPSTGFGDVKSTPYATQGVPWAGWQGTYVWTIAAGAGTLWLQARAQGTWDSASAAGLLRVMAAAVAPQASCTGSGSDTGSGSGVSCDGMPAGDVCAAFSDVTVPGWTATDATFTLAGGSTTVWLADAATLGGCVSGTGSLVFECVGGELTVNYTGGTAISSMGPVTFVGSTSSPWSVTFDVTLTLSGCGSGSVRMTFTEGACP